MKVRDTKMLLLLSVLAALCLGSCASTDPDAPVKASCEKVYHVDVSLKIHPPAHDCSGPGLDFVNIGANPCTLSFSACLSGGSVPENIVNVEAHDCPAEQYFKKLTTKPNIAKFNYSGCNSPPRQVWKLDFGDSLAEPPELGNGPEGETEDQDQDQDEDEGGNESGGA